MTTAARPLLLDVGTTLLAVGLAIVGFVTVVLVCVAVLRLLGVVLGGDGEDGPPGS